MHAKIAAHFTEAIFARRAQSGQGSGRGPPGIPDRLIILMPDDRFDVLERQFAGMAIRIPDVDRAGKTLPGSGFGVSNEGVPRDTDPA